MANVLFIVENDYFPRDARVYNECMTLVKNGYNCFVIAPKQKDESMFEKIDGKVFCFRFLHYESKGLIGLLIEYFIALSWILFYTYTISLTKKIKIIHVANPPDFIIPMLFILKIFGIKIIFDIHDLSVETFKAKNKTGFLAAIIRKTLIVSEIISVKFADSVISTNNSIKSYIESKYANKRVTIVRNSNSIRFKNIDQICKKTNKKCIIGYFGVINNDYASGYENIILLAKLLVERELDFEFQIIGDGSGLRDLERLVEKYSLKKYFTFFGFIQLEKSFELIKSFDFGIVPWPDIPKNNLHTAMKVMDYMCCGVPVCSLTLKEQMVSTSGIGIHKATFVEVATELVCLYKNQNDYETLRLRTLEHFNNCLAWEIQEQELLTCYDDLLYSKMRK